MSKTILEIPLSSSLYQKAEVAVSQYGYSSLQAFVTGVIERLLKKSSDMPIVQDKEWTKPLPKNTALRYDKMATDRSNWYTADSVDDLIDQLLK